MPHLLSKTMAAVVALYITVRLIEAIAPALIVCSSLAACCYTVLLIIRRRRDGW
jgi:hypothetical protein